MIISGQAAQNDEIKEELEEIISGLQSYLSHVRQKAQKETVDYNRLLRDREELLHTLADLEKDREELRRTEAEFSLWKQVKLWVEKHIFKSSGQLFIFLFKNSTIGNQRNKFLEITTAMNLLHVADKEDHLTAF